MTNTQPALKAGAAPVSPFGTNDIRALKPPVEIPSGWLWFWIALAVIVLVVVGWLVWRSWRKKKATPKPEIIIPPHQRARKKLAEALELIGQPRPFCIAVSDTIRVYLEERFEFHAPDRTTEEFLHELRATMLLTIDQKGSLEAFLSVCDMVKFARYEPGPKELQVLHESATRLIDETEPQPDPVGAPGASVPTS